MNAFPAGGNIGGSPIDNIKQMMMSMFMVKSLTGTGQEENNKSFSVLYGILIIGIIEKIILWITRTLEKITAGAHSAPAANASGINTIPSRHRLYNAAGGIGAWIVGRYIMDIMVGETPKGKKVDKEKVNQHLHYHIALVISCVACH